MINRESTIMTQPRTCHKHAKASLAKQLPGIQPWLDPQVPWLFGILSALVALPRLEDRNPWGRRAEAQVEAWQAVSPALKKNVWRREDKLNNG